MTSDPAKKMRHSPAKAGTQHRPTTVARSITSVSADLYMRKLAHPQHRRSVPLIAEASVLFALERHRSGQGLRPDGPDRDRIVLHALCRDLRRRSELTPEAFDMAIFVASQSSTSDESVGRGRRVRAHGVFDVCRHWQARRCRRAVVMAGSSALPSILSPREWRHCCSLDAIARWQRLGTRRLTPAVSPLSRE